MQSFRFNESKYNELLSKLMYVRLLLNYIAFEINSPVALVN